jgi:hypothetical protein
MARGVAEPASQRAAPRFEVVLAPDPSPSELSEALSALSVGVRFGAEELRMLARSDELARRYLAYQPPDTHCTPPAPTSPTPKRARRSGAGQRKGRTKKPRAAQH